MLFMYRMYVADARGDIHQWHAHQLQRENALRRIELNAADKLSVCWERHDRKLAQLIEDHVSGLSVLFLSNGRYTSTSYLTTMLVIMKH